MSLSKNKRRTEIEELPLEAQAEARLAEKLRNQERRNRMAEDKEKRISRKKGGSSKKRKLDDLDMDEDILKEYKVKL